jgi:hypothetical protein
MQYALATAAPSYHPTAHTGTAVEMTVNIYAYFQVVHPDCATIF